MLKAFCALPWQALRPQSFDVRQEELGDMVDKEMASPSAAIEDAVRRIEAIRLLVMTSANLQKEIAESGRGAATPQEFYAKNSRWTEGLISASKAVGWGATQLVESADKVVLHPGKYEEPTVCSHETAASTTQLVAASKMSGLQEPRAASRLERELLVWPGVKAKKSSRNLGKLQECSRTVNEMAANAVASTKSGQEQVEDRAKVTVCGVKALELEKTLENERLRLGELWRQHYGLAGICTENSDAGKPAVAPKPGVLKKPPVAQKPAQASKQDNELDRDAAVYQAHTVNF
ncbi:hypothetical protein lerEdw1_020692 [Lerista edwardsae]|nr:hypothetical protein lerEdw1_020692 [Lerista edwardsae]